MILTGNSDGGWQTLYFPLNFSMNLKLLVKKRSIDYFKKDIVLNKSSKIFKKDLEVTSTLHTRMNISGLGQTNPRLWETWPQSPGPQSSFLGHFITPWLLKLPDDKEPCQPAFNIQWNSAKVSGIKDQWYPMGDFCLTFSFLSLEGNLSTGVFLLHSWFWRKKQ